MPGCLGLLHVARLDERPEPVEVLGHDVHGINEGGHLAYVAVGSGTARRIYHMPMRVGYP